jgi:hypothetical protein
MRAPFKAASPSDGGAFFSLAYLAAGPVCVFVGLAENVSHLQPCIGLGANPIGSGGMIVESVDALKGLRSGLTLGANCRGVRS